MTTIAIHPKVITNDQSGARVTRMNDIYQSVT